MVSVKKKRKGGRELPFRAVAQFWNWIPAFRAVAEAGGVNEAARLLRVSPSALSRSVGLLENALGEPLFFREGGLALTSQGERLLAAARDAMRLLHEAAELETVSGLFTFAATSRLGLYRMLPVIHEVRARWPDLELRTATLSNGAIAGQLLRGQVDVVIALGNVGPDGLVSSPLPEAPCHVYCGPAHPLRAAKTVDDSTIARHLFAVPVGRPEPGGTTDIDSWPTDLPRRVGLRCDSLEPAIDACVRGELLACLPDEVVAALGLKTTLRSLPRPRLPSTRLQCIYRQPIGRAGKLVAEIVTLLARSPVARP